MIRKITQPDDLMDEAWRRGLAAGEHRLQGDLDGYAAAQQSFREWLKSLKGRPGVDKEELDAAFSRAFQRAWGKGKS